MADSADIKLSASIDNGPQVGAEFARNIQRAVNTVVAPNFSGARGGAGSPPGFIKGIGNIGTTAAQQTASLNKATQAIQDYEERTARAAAATKNFAEKIGETTKRFAAYLIPASAIFQFSRGVGVASDSIVELNAEINKLTQILDDNSDRAKQVTSNVLDLAEAYGISGKEIIKVTNVLAQAGQQFGSNDQITRAVEALSRTKLLATFGDIEETTKGAIAALNQFGLSASDLNHVLDISNDLAKKFAVESADFFTAVQSGGAAFAVANGNIEEFSATVATLRQITRLSASTIGTGLNTIALRLLRPDVIKFTEDLTKGVGGVRNAAGQLNGVVGILRQVGAATKGFDSEELAKVIETLSGTRQGKLLAPLLKDIASGPDKSIFEKSFKVIGDSAGSAARDAAVGLERIDVQLASIGARFDKVFAKFAEDKGVQRLVSDFAGLAKGVASVLDVVEPLVPILIKLGTIKLATSIFNNRSDILSGFVKPIGKIATLATGKAGDLSRDNNDYNINTNDPPSVRRAKATLAYFQQNPIQQTVPKVATALPDELLSQQLLKNDRFSRIITKQFKSTDPAVLKAQGIGPSQIVDLARMNVGKSTFKTAEQLVEEMVNSGAIKPPKFNSQEPKISKVPSVPSGMIRFYHGGTSIPGKNGIQGRDYFTPDLAYAQGYANSKTNNPVVSYVDLPKNHPLVQEAFDSSGTNMKPSYLNFLATEEVNRQAKLFSMGQPRNRAPTSPVVSLTPQEIKQAQIAVGFQAIRDRNANLVPFGGTPSPFRGISPTILSSAEQFGLSDTNTVAQDAADEAKFAQSRIKANVGIRNNLFTGNNQLGILSSSLLRDKRGRILPHGTILPQIAQDPDALNLKTSSLGGIPFKDEVPKAVGTFKDVVDGMKGVGEAAKKASVQIPNLSNAINNPIPIENVLTGNRDFSSRARNVAAGQFAIGGGKISDLSDPDFVKRVIQRNRSTGGVSKNFTSDLEDQKVLNDRIFASIKEGVNKGIPQETIKKLGEKLNVGINQEQLLQSAIGKRNFEGLGTANTGIGLNGEILESSNPFTRFRKGSGLNNFIDSQKSGLGRIANRLGGAGGVLAKFGPNALAAGGLIGGDLLLNSIDNKNAFNGDERLSKEFQSTFDDNRVKSIGGNALSLGASFAIAGGQFGGLPGAAIAGTIGTVAGAFRGNSQANQSDLANISLSASRAKTIGEQSNEVNLELSKLGIGVRENVGGLKDFGQTERDAFLAGGVGAVGGSIFGPTGTLIGGGVSAIGSILGDKRNKDLLLNTGREFLSTGSSKIDTFSSLIQEQFRTQQGRAELAPIGEQAKLIAQQVAGQNGFTGDIGGEVRNRLGKESAISRLRLTGLSKEDAEKAFAKPQTQEQKDIILGSTERAAIALKELGIDFNEIGDTVKKNKQEFDKLQNALSKNTASFEEFIFNFNRGTQSINNKTATNAFDLQGRKQVVDSLFGGGGSFQLPSNLGETLFNNISEEIDKSNSSGPLGRQGIFNILDKGTGASLDKNEKNVFADAFAVRNLAQRASIDNLRTISGGTIDDQNKDNVGLIAQKKVEGFLTQNNVGLTTDEGKGILRDFAAKIPDLLRKNPELAKDPNALASTFFKELADGKPVVERFNARFADLSEKIAEINLQYDIQNKLLSSNTQLQNQKFSFATSSIQQGGQLFGANPQTILQQLTGLGDSLPSADLAGAGRRLQNATNFASQFSHVDPNDSKRVLEAAKAFDEQDRAQAEYNAELSKSNNQLSNFRSRLEEASKILGNTIQTRQNLATTPFSERVGSQAQLGIFNSFTSGKATKNILDKFTGPQALAQGLKDGTVTQADLEAAARELGPLAGNSSFINADKGLRPLGGLASGGAGGQTLNQRADLAEFISGLGINPTGGTISGNVGSFAQQALTQAGLFQSTQDIEKNQLTNLQQINQNIAKIATQFKVPGIITPTSTTQPVVTNATTQPTSPVSSPATQPIVSVPTAATITPIQRITDKTQRRLFEEGNLTSEVSTDLENKGNADTKKLSDALHKFSNSVDKVSTGQTSLNKSELKLDANVVLSGVQGLGNDVVVQEASIAVLDKLATILIGGTIAEQHTANNIRAAIKTIRGNNKK